MNILLIVAALFMICKIVDGYKKGMVKEIISLVSLIVVCAVVALILRGVNSYWDKDYINVVIAVALLVVIGIAHHVLGVIFFSAKVISKLPIVSWMNKLLGMVFGILETVLILWTIYTFIMFMDLGIIGQQILVYTQESPVLTWVYEHNYLAKWLVEDASEFGMIIF